MDAQFFATHSHIHKEIFTAYRAKAILDICFSIVGLSQYLKCWLHKVISLFFLRLFFDVDHL